MYPRCMYWSKIVSVKNVVKEWGEEVTPLLGKVLCYLLIAVTPIMLCYFSVNGKTFDMRTIRSIMVLCSGIVFISMLQKNKFLILLCVWCVINWWLNFLPFFSYLGMQYLMAILAVYVGIKKLLAKNILSVKIVLKVLCGLVIFQFLWLCMQYFFKVDPIFFPVDCEGNYTASKLPYCGWSGNTALLGVFFSMTAFLLLEYIPALFFIVLMSVLMVKNATTAIAFAVSGLFYILYTSDEKNVRQRIIGVLILIVIFLLWYKSPNFDRWPVWHMTLHYIKSIRPIVGIGLNGFPQLNIFYESTPWREAHNDYLQVWCELGTIGISIFSLFIFSKMKEFFSVKRNRLQVGIASCLLSFLISSVTMFSMHVAQLSFIAIILLACLERTYE